MTIRHQKFPNGTVAYQERLDIHSKRKLSQPVYIIQQFWSPANDMPPKHIMKKPWHWQLSGEYLVKDVRSSGVPYKTGGNVRILKEHDLVTQRRFNVS